MEKIVFFELIDAAYDALVDKYLKNDFIIYFFKTDKKFINRAKIKQYIKAEKLLDASSIIFKYELYRQASFLAHENVDAIFEKYFSSSPAIGNMARLLDFPDIENMYKKELLLVLEQLYEIELKINEIIKNCGANDIHFVPDSYIELHSETSSPIQKNIRIVDYRNSSIHLRKFIIRIKNTALLAYPVFLIFKKIKSISKNKSRKEFKVGISIGPHIKSIFEMNYWTEKMFIDDKEFPKEHVLFIDENGSKNIRGYEQRGYNYTRLIDDREIISYDMFWNKIINRFLPVWLKTVLLSMSETQFMIKTNRMILTDYIKWNFFNDNFRIQNYVKRLLPDNISHIHVLRQNYVSTWFVFLDNTSHDYHLGWSHDKKNITLFSFMYYDVAVIYGNIIERFFRKHRNFINEYVKIGVLYSQIIRQLDDGTLNSTLPYKIRTKRLPKRIIGIFDTTYVSNGPVKIADGIRFGNDILRLLEDFPDMGFIFKAMKWPEVIPYLNPIYDKLKNHERCLIYYMWEGISASEVIAFSDFVISAAYTSTSAEALAARKKAIYYDVAGHDIGDKFYYNRYPNFVAHNYEELKKLINYWMNQVTDSEFEKFLNHYVKDEIDPYLDCRALTRLRKLLMGEEHGG